MSSNVIDGHFGEPESVQGEVLSEEILEAPSYHTILEVWREVLKPAAQEATKNVTAGWANRILSAYHGLEFKNMVLFRDRYFAKLEQLFQLVLDEIATDADCLSYGTPEEDREENAQHYKNLLRSWQLAILQWELDWDCTAPDAAIEVAAISEVHKMFFGQQGITAFLDNIQLEFTEEDQQELADALEELREGAS